jgi:hypothetical protein
VIGGDPVTQANAPPSTWNITWASATAFLVAGVVVVAVVLPAEYGIDPLGTGGAFGLLGLSRVQPIGAEEDAYKTDILEFELAPTEWAESTYRLEEGSTMLFSWEATGAVSFNFHSSPDGAPPGYAESFDSREVDLANGSYTAPFTGTHGWYWENLGSDYVTIRFTTAGFYSDAHQARDRVSGFHPLRNARGELTELP